LNNINIIIPIGGIGKRFSDDGYNQPKPLIKALGKSIIFWNIENLNIGYDDIVYIVYRSEFSIYNFEDLLKNKFPKLSFRFICIDNDTRGASETVLYALNSMSDDSLKKTTLVVDSDNFYDEDIVGRCKEMCNNLIFYKKDYDKTPIYSYINTIDGRVLDIKEKDKISDNACVGAYCFESGHLLLDTIRKVIISDKRDKNEFYISSLYKYLIENNIDVYSSEINGFTCLGTPNQVKSFSSNLNSHSDKYRFCFDLDNTLVTFPVIEGDYKTVKPIHRTINFVNYLYTQGHTIIIHTARRMRTHNGNIGSVIADIGKITIDTLNEFGINYHELYFGKPHAHFYIDDLAISAFDDLEKETGFYNIHPQTRSHNKIEIFDKYIIKYSESIDGEKFYYKNIPNEVKDLFPMLLDDGDDFIKLEKIQGIPLSFLNTNGTLSEDNILNLLDSINRLHSLKTTKDINIYSNYLNKFEDRINQYDYSVYDNFESIKSDLIDFLKRYEDENRGLIGVIHGDPVLTNILIDGNNNLKMIDMRGKVGDMLTIYGDIFYDYAKIYQSLIGYDHILMDKEIDLNQINYNKRIFNKFIIDNFGEDKLLEIKQLTKSLIITLIPIHNNDKCISFYNLISSV